MYQDIDGVALMIQDVCVGRGRGRVNDRIVQPRWVISGTSGCRSSALPADQLSFFQSVDSILPDTDSLSNILLTVARLLY